MYHYYRVLQDTVVCVMYSRMSIWWFYLYQQYHKPTRSAVHCNVVITTLGDMQIFTPLFLGDHGHIYDPGHHA